MKEEWKVVPGHSQYYISNQGRLMNARGHIMRTSLRNGYPSAGVVDDSFHKHTEYIHRFVALAFVNNPEQKPCINHIDCDRTNNCYTNLEWCTKKENSEWMSKLGRNKRTPEWIESLNRGLQKMRKTVMATNTVTHEKRIYNGVNSTKKDGFSPGLVSDCCNGKSEQHKGWRFEFL